MKTISTIITVCFMLGFALAFQHSNYNITTSNVGEIKDIKKMIIGESLSMNDPNISAMIPDLQIQIMRGSEYVKAAFGAAIGWVVKAIFDFIFAWIRKTPWTDKKKIEEIKVS